MSGEKQESSGIPVQPVDTAIRKWLSFLPEIVGTGVGKRVVVISLRWVNRHSRRLIEDEKILILVNNRKWERRRYNIFRGFGFNKMERERIFRS